MLKLDDAQFSFRSIGELSTTEPYRHMERVMKSYEVIFVTNGILYMEEDGIKYELYPNQIIVLEPDKLHRGYKVYEGGTSFYWMHYTTDSLPIPFKTYLGNEYHEAKQLLKKLLHIAYTPAYSVYARDALALSIYEELKKISILSDSFKPVIKKAIEHVRINIKEKVTVASIAKELGYNPDYLSKAFCNAMGMTLKKYITVSKLKAAKDYLHSSELSVKQIAYELGFENEMLFVKFFSYHEKMSPAAYRNKYFNTYITKGTPNERLHKTSVHK